MSAAPPAPRAFLTRIGPIERPRGSTSAIYLALDAEGAELGRRVESPPNDGAAIRALAESLTSHALSCGLDLATVGAPLGFDVSDLPPRAAEARAAAAYLAWAPEHLEVKPAALRVLFAAAVEYQRAKPWTKLAVVRRFPAKEIIRAPSGEVFSEQSLLVQVLSGDGPDGPEVHVELDHPSLRGRHASPLRVEVTLASEPRWIARAVGDAYGELLFPRVTFANEERLAVPNDSHALLAAAAMRAAVDHVRGGKGRGRADAGFLAWEVDVDFTKSRPLPPLPTGDDPRDLRTVGRLMAESLAAQVPLPYYDGHVCVVLDERDPQTERAKEILEQTANAVSASDPEGFANVSFTLVRVQHFGAMWMRAEHMAEMLAHNALPWESIAPLKDALPPYALRVLLFGSHRCEAFFVDFPPMRARQRRERLRDQARLHETREAEGDDEDDARAPAELRDGAGAFRDGLVYLPTPLPDGWRVVEKRPGGVVALDVGPLSVVIAAERREGRRWVNVYFREHPEGRPVTLDEARTVYEKMVGCGRFIDMTLSARDAAHVPLAGTRLFSATLAIKRPRSVAPERSAREDGALLERAKACIAEVIARVRDHGGFMRDYCVLVDTNDTITMPGGLPGVVLSRDFIERTFVTPETDPFQIRARFEQPRPPDECVVFVKHPDAIEEIHVSLEGVESVPEREA